MAQKQYLDLHGLQLLWSKIKSADEELVGLINGLDFSKVNDIKYVDGKIALFADNVQVGNGFDVSDFLKDGMIDDVEIVSASAAKPILGQTEGKFIKFVWNVTDESTGESKVDYISVSDLLSEIKVDLSEVEGRLDKVEGDLDSAESLLSSLSEELDQAQADIIALKAIHGGEVSFEDIERNEEGEWVNDSENAPKASAVVTALNELRSELKGDYYNKEQINEMLDQKQDLMEAIPESEILELWGN